MTFKMMTAFAVILAVIAVSAGLVANLCYRACQQTEQQELACRADCSYVAGDPRYVTPSCDKKCSRIGDPCRLFCVENYRSCWVPCRQREGDFYSCVVTCIQQAFAENQTSTAI